uniref:TAXI family TRAP transporter solute-binding subunit n=1 Tax=Halomonas sp. TaxID=1486246 RepID=UPI00261789E8|nr:TAXI family TRAP transporter solute-binding subunit [Halomonas sp.]
MAQPTDDDDQPEITTFGVRATLLANDATNPDQVYELVAAVFDNFERFTTFHPAYTVLTPETMIKDGLSAPLHEGALRYYQEQGWMEADDALGRTTWEMVWRRRRAVKRKKV